MLRLGSKRIISQSTPNSQFTELEITVNMKLEYGSLILKFKFL